MNAMNFIEPEERTALRKAVAELGAKYGHEYYAEDVDRQRERQRDHQQAKSPDAERIHERNDRADN